jgi:hypothetical protein
MKFCESLRTNCFWGFGKNLRRILQANRTDRETQILASPRIHVWSPREADAVYGVRVWRRRQTWRSATYVFTDPILLDPIILTLHWAASYSGCRCSKMRSESTLSTRPVQDSTAQISQVVWRRIGRQYLTATPYWEGSLNAPWARLWTTIARFLAV